MSLKFLAGVALGAIVVHFLNTEEGKAFVGRFKKDVSDVEDNISQFAEDLVEKGRSFVNGTSADANDVQEGSPLIVVVESNPVV